MRLSSYEIEAIRKVIAEVDPSAKVFLYGSRTRDDLKGGDIDLAIVSETFTFSKKIDFLVNLKELIGDQRIDVTIFHPEKSVQDPFYLSIKASFIPLAG
jgi:predicted nucleotidyltransferase